MVKSGSSKISSEIRTATELLANNGSQMLLLRHCFRDNSSEPVPVARCNGLLSSFCAGAFRKRLFSLGCTHWTQSLHRVCLRGVLVGRQRMTQVLTENKGAHGSKKYSQSRTRHQLLRALSTVTVRPSDRACVVSFRQSTASCPDYIWPICSCP